MKSDIVIAVSRFGLGARPGDFNRPTRNPKHWLLDQLQGPSQLPAEIRNLPSSSDSLVEVQRLRRMRNEQAKMEEHNNKNKKIESKGNSYGRTVRRHYMDQVAARYRVAISSDFPFYERLVHFWANHFAVSADKQPISAIAGLYEQEAIRPNIVGKFADLLIAAEQHPAMILYLDNQRSIGTNSEFVERAKKSPRKRTVGLNENLAREILELHTLGVSGGYSQNDVTTFAEVITGWTVGGLKGNRRNDGEPGIFIFDQGVHTRGPKIIMGKTYNQSGRLQGEAVLRDLATHPATAFFLATKLARHFVADDPPLALVKKMAVNYLQSDGELSALYETIIQSDQAWAMHQGKFKSPHDFVISTFRAFNHVPDDAGTVFNALQMMGQEPYRPGSPAGWPDTALDLGGADALYKRVEWSNQIARVVGRRVNPVDLGDAVLDSTLSARTRRAISQAESLVQGMTLLLASPDFQRR